jgi:hypothetical protein
MKQLNQMGRRRSTSFTSSTWLSEHKRQGFLGLLEASKLSMIMALSKNLNDQHVMSRTTPEIMDINDTQFSAI